MRKKSVTSPVRIAVALPPHSAFDREIISGIASVAQNADGCIFSLADRLRVIETAQGDCDGIICRVSDPNMAKGLHASGKCVIDLLGAVPGRGFDQILTDDEGIGQAAAEHYLERDYVHYAFCGEASIGFSERRGGAFVRRLRQAGKSCEVLELPPQRPKDGYLLGVIPDRRLPPFQARRLLSWLRTLSKPAAIFCCNDLRASQVLQCCTTLGLSVPGDIALLGVDDDPVFTSFSTVRLSSIDPNAFQIGRLAAETALTRIKRPEKHPQRTTLPVANLFARDSTAIRPGGPDWLTTALVYIKRNATAGISAADVLKHLGLPHSSVQKYFRETLHSGIQREIARTRLEAAERLLRETTLPVADIARRCGYRSSIYFCRAFAASHRRTPSVWRKLTSGSRR